MNFGEALQALKDGKKVTRSIWSGYWEMRHVRTTAEEYDECIMIMAFLKDGGVAPAQPYQSDLLAEDWQIIG